MKKLLSTVSMVLALSLGAGAASAECAKSLRIGVEGAYPPFSEVTADGKLKGFDIDIAYALCAEMGSECTMVQQDWDGMIPALIARKFDAIIASMSITEERKQKVDFTAKYYNTPAKFIAKTGSGLEITAAGLKGKKIGVQRATTHDNFITDNFPDAEIVRYGTQDEVYLDLQAGRLDAALQDSVAADDGFLKTDNGKGFGFVGGSFSDPRWFGDGAGIALRKGEDDLKKCLDDAIDTIRANGKYKAINDTYFAFDVFG